MLSVCHIASGDLWAGAEVVAYQLLKGLKGFDSLKLSAIFLNEGELARKVRDMGIKVHVIDETRKAFWSILLTARKEVAKDPPDIIHSHGYKENILAWLISPFVGRPRLIATQHGMQEINGPGLRLRNRIASKGNFLIMSHLFHRVVGVSRDIQNELAKRYGFNEKRVSLIHNGIEIPESAPAIGERKEKFVVGSSGRLFPIKDYPLMIESAKAIREKTNYIQFQLAGDGPEMAKLQALIKNYDLCTCFELKGHLENMSAFYRGLDLYVSTSVHEGLPVGILEAMAHGVPVIASRVGGISEIIDDGVQGFLLEERTERAFAEKCLLLYKDKELRQRMGESAREKVTRSFSAAFMAEQYLKLYSELLELG
jgi:glycosyltransferase involved in cell wall biosynthesis